MTRSLASPEENGFARDDASFGNGGRGCRASLEWPAEGGCPHIGIFTGARLDSRGCPHMSIFAGAWIPCPVSDKVSVPMLDLNFVRDNLPLVEEMLRQRGADPAAVLKDFHEVDRRRRHAITEAETMKAQRNKASEDISKLKKSGQDASRAIAETKDLREQIQTREKGAADLDERLQEILSCIPNIKHATVPAGHSAEA